MARRRLNKKVALIGSVVFVFMILGAILAFLYLSRDPQKFIKDGDAALIAAHEAQDEEIKQQEYIRAIRSYHKARALAKTDVLKVEMLLKLVDIYMELDDWRTLLKCWNSIVQIDSENIKARFGRLKYIYIVADTTSNQLWQWQEIESQASELIEVVEEKGLIMEDTATYDYPAMRETGATMKRLGPYLYQRRGRATLEIARLGAVTDPGASLLRAIGDLEKAREIEPNNVDTYRYLAQALIEKGEILATSGDIEGRDESRKQAEEILGQAVEVSGTDVTAHVNILAMKSVLAQLSGGMEQFKSFEPEYLSLVEKFGSSGKAFSSLALFYSKMGHKYLDKAIEAMEKAVELDSESVAYAINAANLHYRGYSIFGRKSDIYRAIELAEGAFALPNAQDTPGPRQRANRMNRISLYLFLANCYIEQILDPCEVRTEEENKKWLADAERVVHELEQLFGSGEDPHVVQWQGMLELAKGNKNVAVRKLYVAYEHLKASGMEEPRMPSLLLHSYSRLCYVLAKSFEGTSELGAVTDFFSSALRTGIAQTQPEAALDYVEVLMTLRAYDPALSGVNFFENQYWTNERSQLLRSKIYIAAKQFNEAEEELAKRKPDDPNTIELNLALVESKIEELQGVMEQKEMEKGLGVIVRQVSDDEKEGDESQAAELERYNSLRAKLIGKLLLVKPDSIGASSIAAVCDDYIAEGKVEQAEELVNQFLKYSPVDTTALFYKKMLSEPGLGEISEQRRKEIEEQVLSGIADPVERSLRLGEFYQKHDEPNKAAAEFAKVLQTEVLQESKRPAFDMTEEVTDAQRFAADHLLEVELRQENWEMAEKIVEMGRHKNLDDCDGQFFAARLAMAKGEYEKVLARTAECLKQKPIFSYAYILRSNANAALGNEHASIEDAKRAASLNPLDITIGKELAFLLYQRNEKLGDNVSSDQIIETRDALNRAMALNLLWEDLNLVSFYAEYIVSTQPVLALAMRQKLQKIAPSVPNAVLLGRMATGLASTDKNMERRDALFAIAAASFEQARKMDPNDKTTLVHYAEYLRASGQEEKAEQLLQESKDQGLRWAYYFQGGQFEDAKKILDQLYQNGQKDSNIIKGLLLIAEKMADVEAVKRYSEELLLLEDTLENRLFQIQTFFEVGLIKEAEYKLQSFKEMFPDESRAMLFEAWLAMKKGQLEKALDLTNRNLEISQNDAIAWRLRGQINLLMANYDQAIIDLKRAKSLSDDPLIRFTLARAYQRAGRGEDAITELESTLSHPQAPTQTRVFLEQLYWQLQKEEALKTFYDETLKKFPDSVEWYNRAATFAMAVEETDRAEQLYKKAWQKSLEKGTGSGAALQGYLRAIRAGGNLNKFFEEAGKYVDGDFAPAAFVEMAEAKLEFGDKETAIAYLRKALDKAGANETLMSNILGKMHAMLGPEEGAEEVQMYCKERLETNPDSLIANMIMFNLKMASGEYNSAIGYIDRCLQIIGPDNPSRVGFITRKAEAYTLAYGKTSDNNYLNKAIAEYESLLAKTPNNPSVLNNLAYLLAEENVRLVEALEYSERAYKALPNDPGFLDTYSYILYKNGRLSEAVELLHSALQQYEQNRISAPAEVYEHLGMIKEGLGAVDEAIAAYEQALEVGAGTLTKAAKERIRVEIQRLSE